MILKVELELMLCWVKELIKVFVINQDKIQKSHNLQTVK